MVDNQGKDKTKQEKQTPGNEAEHDELKQAAQQFFRSLFRAGVQLALVPVNMLPPESQEHFKVAGREFTRGLATLAREIADDVEKIVEESKESQGNE